MKMYASLHINVYVLMFMSYIEYIARVRFRGTPLYYFEISIVDWRTLKISAPIFSNFEGKARTKKTQFFGQSFPKSA